MKLKNSNRKHLNAEASSDPSLAIRDHRRELKALQTHNISPIWVEVIGEPPNASGHPSHLSTFSLLHPEVSFAKPSTIRFEAFTWPSRCVCLITPLLQHQNMPGIPMTLRSYPGNNPASSFDSTICQSSCSQRSETTVVIISKLQTRCAWKGC